ncbi:MAG TPA: immunogenic protein, partial [Rhodospirillaceae bacterium]|nr:immunogenic protein [Rhodospirillaceae bacterium]
MLTVFLLTGLFFTGLALGEVDPAENGEDITFFRIGTGATSGTYFPIGGLIASAISNPPGSRACDRGGSCGVPGMIAVAQSTEGSVANIEAIAGGELESGLSQADVAHWALTGTKVFAKKKKAKGKNNKDKNKKPLGETLRAIANLFPENVHLVVRADKGIKSVFNLQKKRVSLGEPESGTLASVLLVLKGYGLTRKDMKPLYLPPG